MMVVMPRLWRVCHRRGYVTLAPDYPGSGDYKIDAYAKAVFGLD